MNRTRASSVDAFGTRNQRNRIYPALEASDGSTLSLDFTQMSSLDSRFTFDRSSSTTSGGVGTATFINSSGYVQSVAAGVPRFDYDPTTLVPRGLLIEGSATNLAKYSDTLNQVSGVSLWYGSNFNTPAIASGVSDPANGANTWKAVAASGAGYHCWRQTTACTAASYTFSIWAKAAEYDRIVISDLGSGRGACTFVLSGNGTRTPITGGGGTPTATITPYPNGWYRCSITMTMTAANYGIAIGGYPSSGATVNEFGASYTADGTSGVYLWGYQSELGSGASSYIPTTSAAVTRAADQCFIADASPFQVSTTNGTLYWSGIIHKQTPAAYTEIVGFMDSTQPTFEVYTNGLNVGVAARGTSLNSGGANEVTRTYTLNAQTRYACSVNTTSNPIVAAVLNGGTVGTNNKSGTGDLYASTRFVLGRQPTSSYGSFMPCMTFAQVKYWPVTKTQAELNLLTTT